MNDNTNTEEDSEEEVGGEVGGVAVELRRDGALGGDFSTVFVGTVRHFARGKENIEEGKRAKEWKEGSETTQSMLDYDADRMMRNVVLRRWKWKEI